MKHEPRPAFPREKQLGQAHNLGGAESLEIFKASQTVLARLMESWTWHQLAGSVGAGFRKQTLAFADLDARHLSFSLYTTGAFQAATPVLRGSESM